MNAQLRDQQTLPKDTAPEKEDLRAALRKAESENEVLKASLVISKAKCRGLEKAVMELRSHISLPKEEGSPEEPDVQAENENEVLKASLVISNAKVRGLEKEVMELRSHINLPKEEGSPEEPDVQEPPRSAGGDLSSAGSSSRRQSEASPEEPPRKRVAVSGQTESGRRPVAGRDADVDAIARDRAESERRLYGWGALHFAAVSGDATDVRELLDRGFDPLVRDRDGRTPLHLAVDRRDRGHFPLYIAALEGHVAVAKVILVECAWRGIEISEGDLSHPLRTKPLRPRWIRSCMDLVSKCKAEIRRMKETVIGRSSISYYDVATRHASVVAMYLRNQSVREELLGGRVASGVRYYADLISRRVGRAEERRVLLEECLESLSLLFRKLPPLPQSCMEIVLRYMTESDMTSVIQSVTFC